ncbi:TPA: hypothetical protein ACJVUY_000405 [Streptococcus pneumoniae]
MNKGKIIKIIEDTAYIGYEDGSLKEIPIESCDFEPRMGDYVEVYGDIVIKVESSPVKKHKSRKSKIKPLLIALVVIVLSVSAYFIMSKITTSQNTSDSSKSSTSSSKSSSSSSSQESSSSSTKSSISGLVPKSLLTIDDEERMDKQKYSSSFDYDKWIHDEFPHYMKIRVSGEVVQVKDPDDKGTVIQIVSNELGSGYGEPIAVFIPNGYLSRVIVEGDKLVLYGITYGVLQTTTDNSVILRPFMIAYLYERDK